MALSVARAAAALGEGGLDTIALVEGFLNNYAPATGTLGSAISFLAPAPVKAAWGLGKIAAGSLAAGGNFYLEKTENEAGGGMGSVVANDIQRVDASIQGMNMLYQGMLDVGCSMIGSRVIGGFATSQFSKLTPYMSYVFKAGGAGLAQHVADYFTGSHKESVMNMAVDVYWRHGASTVGATEYHKDWVAWVYGSTVNKQVDAVTLSLVDSISTYVGGKGWQAALVTGASSYAGSNMNAYVAQQEVGYRRAKFQRTLAESLVKAGFFKLLTEGRLPLSVIQNTLKEVRASYSQLDERQVQDLFSFASQLSDSGKAAFFMRLNEEGFRDSDSAAQANAERLGNNYTTIKDTAADSYFAGSGEHFKLIPGSYDGDEMNDAIDWFQLLKGVPIALGLIAAANKSRMAVQRAANTDKELKSDVTMPTPMAKTKALAREAKIDALYLEDVVTKLQDGAPHKLITDGNTSSSDKVYIDFIKRLQDTTTFQVPPAQQVFELVAAAASSNKTLINAPDYSAPSRSSLGYMAGSFIRNKLHLAPVINGPRTGLGVNKFNRREMGRKKVNQRSYNNFK